MKRKRTEPVTAIDDGEDVYASWVAVIDRLRQVARSAGSAVLVADQQWTRRQRVHYVWWPDQDPVELFRSLHEILDAADEHGITELHVYRDVTDSKYRAIIIGASSDTEDP